MQFHDYRSIFVSSVLWKQKKTKTTFQQRWQHMSIRRHRNMKENNKDLHYWFPMGWNQPRTMESPHKGPATWKAFIMQFQYFRSTYDGKTHFTQQWKHMHVLGFHLTVNFIVNSTIHAEKCKKTSKFHTTDPFWGESIGDQWTRITKGQQCENP